MPNNKRRILLYGGKRSRPCILWLWSKRLSYKRNSEAYNWILCLLLTAWSNILSTDLWIKCFALFPQISNRWGSNRKEYGSKLNLTKTKRTDSGVYTCIATNGVGQPDAAQITLRVQCKLRFWRILPITEIRTAVAFLRICHTCVATNMYSYNVIVSAVNSKDMVVLRIWTLLAKNGSCWYVVRFGSGLHISIQWFENVMNL